ncbi:unnamed protein product [Spirodela intermedia]|uniref:CRAL-TRIO domain-containing protein n=1 Tax=Spirodela intermedia TaxID=51605 RepID=A0A7I8ID19_SPIIN|nr:unnamed protein product [Spirodela intermedia]CAA6654942.1 unnamed protein product [Spirodela intermedia]
MGDYSCVPGSSKISELSTSLASNKMKNCSLVASSSRPISEKMVKRGPTGRVLMFLLKVAALEVVRRVSEVKCPLVWRVLQGFQFLGYVPLKWLQRWSPIRNTARLMQTISRPLLFLSITTSISDCFENSKARLDNEDDQQQHSETPAVESAPNLGESEEAEENIASENWLAQLHNDLEKQGIVLPQRIDDDELGRFHAAANGDFSFLVKSIRKTIRWRETYAILSPQQLEPWSHLVFWHGYDVKLRPCLVIRLGLACTSLPPPERPRFTQAVVSQVEHGVLFLLNKDDPRITVLMDCAGLSPVRIPMNMMRSCSAVMQDHYPNRLSTLYVTRLPRWPTTREKLRVLGEANQKAILAEALQAVPSFLGGRCGCNKCETLRAPGGCGERRGMPAGGREAEDDDDEEEEVGGLPLVATDGATFEQVARTAVVGILMLWIFLAYLVGMNDTGRGGEGPPCCSPDAASILVCSLVLGDDAMFRFRRAPQKRPGCVGGALFFVFY